jgi:uncharacterized protein YbaR (Trm112 family)
MGFMEVTLLKLCPSCEVEKPLDAFYRSRLRKDGHEVWCKDCQRAHRKRRSATSSGREANRRYAYKKRYGDPAIYDRLVLAQEGRCALCGRPEDGQRLRVDHDHRTGANRALLCHKCNQALGFFNDTPGLLRKAAAYLEFHGR